MGEQVELTVEQRTVQGKAVKALRRQGIVPAVVYGADDAAQSVMAPYVNMAKAYKLAGKRQPVELLLGKTKRLAMIKSADFDPIKHELRHLAFHVINRNERVTAEVPVVVSGEGETPAERAGLVVLKTIESVEISALPSDLPDSIVAPGEKLIEIGDRLTVGDLKAPKGVTVMTDPAQVLATVYEPSALAAANAAAGGDAEEPIPPSETEAENENASETKKEAADSKEKH
jgi:large subunit ribosomal protein L25